MIFGRFLYLPALELIILFKWMIVNSFDNGKYYFDTCSKRCYANHLQEMRDVDDISQKLELSLK